MRLLITKNFEMIDDFRVILPKPILIRPGYTYEIKIEIKNLPSTERWCTMEKLRHTEVVDIEPDIIVRFYDNPINDGGEDLIETLIFNLI